MRTRALSLGLGLGIGRKTAGFAGGTSSISVDMILDLAAQTPGATVTVAALNGAKIGGVGFTYGTTCGASHPTGTPNRTTFETDGTAPNYTTPRRIGSVEYTGEGDLVINIAHTGRAGDDAEWERFDDNPDSPPIAESDTESGFIKPGSVGGAAQAFLDVRRKGGGGTYSVLQQFVPIGGTTGVLRIHTDDVAAYGAGYPVTSQWYRYDLRHNTVDGYGELILREDDAIGTVLHAERLPTAATGFSTRTFGDELAVNGGNTRLKGITSKRGAGIPFPLDGLSGGALPSPTGVTVALTAANEVTVTKAGITTFDWKIERNKNSAGWATLSSTQTGTTYVDTDLTVGDSVTYRVTNQINAHSSSATSSTPYTVETFIIPLANLHFWLEGDSGVENSSGVAATNGQTVQFWRDKSDNGRDFAQNTAGARPTLDTTGINNLPTVIGDGTDDVMTYANTADISHIFIVCQERSTADPFQGVMGIRDNGAAAGDYDAALITTGDVGTKSSVRCGLGTGTTFTGSVSGAGVIAANVPFLWEIRMDRATGMVLDSWIDGVSIGRGSSATAALPCGTVALFASYWQGNITDFGPFDIAAVVAYTTVLNDTKRAQVSSYLNGKYLP